MFAKSYTVPEHGEIVPIGGERLQSTVGNTLAAVLSKPYNGDQKRTLPDELLYDDVGLPIWNKIIFTPTFYQTHDEIALFQAHASEIVDAVKAGVTMIDLGAGDTRKVAYLLQAFENRRREATYLALDISKTSLKENVARLVKNNPEPDAVVRCAGLWGTFEDGQSYASMISGPRLFLSLGSVLCNDDWDKAVSNLSKWAALLRPEDRILVGMDAHLLPNDKDKIWAAYHSQHSDGLFRQFWLNGFAHANRLAGETVFNEEDFEFKAEMETEPTTRHRFFFRAKQDIPMGPYAQTIRQGEEIDWFDSHKYGEHQVELMCKAAKVDIIKIWQAPNSEFRQYLLKKRTEDHDDNDSAVSGL